MRLTRPLFFTVLVGVTALTILQLTLTSVTKAAVPVGCTPTTADGVFDPSETIAFWNDQEIGNTSSLAQAGDNLLGEKVLGTSSNKWIEVDLSDQRLTAHEGDSIFLTTLISSGLTNKTPVGEYNIWYKIAYTKMEGGNKLNHTYYYLPNVPFSMFFNGDIGIHGTYWHNNFGHPMSHGCVNTPTDMAQRLFYWVDPQLPQGKKLVRATADNPGTRVVVHE